MIRHHPSGDVLSDWARGALHAGAMLAVACHIHGCANCREETALWESLGGALLNSLSPTPLRDDALVRIFQRLDSAGAARAAPRERRVPAFLRRFDLPTPLLKQRIGMRRWVTPDIWFAPIEVQPRSAARTYLVHAKRNTTLLKHTHVGREFTSVLFGSYTDATGTYDPGDFCEADETVVHAPAVSGEAGCLCLG
ncbi:MAG TPA: ChrR family anti-sigma-E factor, partial [Rhizomicrobium sp.]